MAQNRIPEPEPSNEKRPGEISRKIYVKPQFEFERAFETMALACGKINNAPNGCRGNRKSS